MKPLITMLVAVGCGKPEAEKLVGNYEISTIYPNGINKTFGLDLFEGGEGEMEIPIGEIGEVTVTGGFHGTWKMVEKEVQVTVNLDWKPTKSLPKHWRGTFGG